MIALLAASGTDRAQGTLRTGHDDQLPQVARRLADHVYDQFGPAGLVLDHGLLLMSQTCVAIGRTINVCSFATNSKAAGFQLRRGVARMRHVTPRLFCGG